MPRGINPGGRHAGVGATPACLHVGYGGGPVTAAGLLRQLACYGSWRR